MTALVVDPSTTIRRIAALALAELGFDEITEARDGREAADAATPSVSLVVTEMDAPGLDALEFVRKLKAAGSPKVLMISSRNARSEVLEALDAGVDGYLLKPFTGEELHRRLASMIAVMRETTSETEPTAAGSGRDATGDPGSAAAPQSLDPPITDAVHTEETPVPPVEGEAEAGSGSAAPENEAGVTDSISTGDSDPGPDKDLDRAA